MRTPIWEKARAADVSGYASTAYAEPLQRFVDHMVKEGQASTHTPSHVARWGCLSFSYISHISSPYGVYSLGEISCSSSLPLRNPFQQSIEVQK